MILDELRNIVPEVSTTLLISKLLRTHLGLATQKYTEQSETL